MTDLADYTPGEACLAARETLLQGIMATWRKPITRSSPKAVAPLRHERVIDLDAEKEAVARLWTAWRKAAEAKDKLLAACAENHTSPGHNYWEAEHRARAHYIAAATLLEVLTG